MAIDWKAEQRAHYRVVRVEGEPTLDEFLDFVQRLGRESTGWPTACLLADLRGVRSLKSFTEHYAVGEAVGRHLGHLRRVASVVPADRITRASEKTAQRAGVDMCVFTSEAEAMQWLTSGAKDATVPRPAPAPAPDGADNPSPMSYIDLSQDPAAMRRVFLALGLAQPQEPVQALALAGGVSSGIYRVDLRSGRYCLKQALPQLKVAKEWKVPVERVFAEIDWLRTAARFVPGHVPQVLGQDDASKSFVMPFLGPEFRHWKTELLAGRVDPAVARAVGDVLGRIHAASADDPALAQRFATDANFHAIRLEPYLVETARVHPALSDNLLATALRTAATRRVLVHGDVSPKNILLGPQGPVLLDAECAWFGDPAFDLAFCLNHFLLKAAHRPADGAALLASYRALRDAYLPHVHWEPVAALEGRAAALLPALALARIDGKSPVEYLGEAQRAAVRATAIGLLRSAPDTLESIAARWAREFSA